TDVGLEVVRETLRHEPECFCEGLEGRATEVVAAAGKDDPALRMDGDGQLAGQAALADASLALDQDKAGAAVSRAPPGFAQPLVFRRAADQDLLHDRPEARREGKRQRRPPS